MASYELGIIGLAVMGQNLALNAAGKGFRVAVYNRTAARTEAFLRERAQGLPVAGFNRLEEFVASLERPRRILLMVKAGPPVDEMLAQLAPLLAPGDVVMDGGNSHFLETRRRQEEWAQRGVAFLGVGISGGEYGALHGPSLMPGGQEEAYRWVEPIFQRIAAQVEGEPCVAYIGPDGAGHFVKMVHNGIEYADMQLIAEAYDLMRRGLGWPAERMAEVFAAWNAGELESYLIEITAHILRHRDEETGKPLVDLILDAAEQKGTGKWTAQAALDLGAPVPTLAEAVFARFLSALKEERVEASRLLRGPSPKPPAEPEAFVEQLQGALYAAKVCVYAQGFALLRQASQEYGWNLNLAELARIWRGGCIIRARFLNAVRSVYQEDPGLPHLLHAPFFREALARRQEVWRRVVAQAVEWGIPVPAFASALAYYDGYRSERLPANLIQASRDYFGAHTYRRLDKEGVFHTQWEAI